MEGFKNTEHITTSDRNNIETTSDPFLLEDIDPYFENIDFAKGLKGREEREAFVEKDTLITERTKDVEVLYRYARRFAGQELTISEKEPNVYVIESPSLPEFLPKMPEEYGYKGGAARVVLESTLGFPSYQPRDIDIIFLGQSEDSKVSDDLAKRYMPDDFANGYGVEGLEEDYFETRDFTLNEVYFDGKNIVASKQCLLDTMRRVVRITNFEKVERDYDEGDYFVNPKLLAKALRFLSQEKDKGNTMSFANDEAISWIGIDAFHMALHLDRAAEQGELIAQRYVDELVERDQLPREIQTLAEVKMYLKEELYDFVFKAPSLQRLNNDEWEDSDDFWDVEFKEYEELPLRQSHRKERK